ncbi:glycosyltransferase family 4 protein [Methanosarcina sp. MSH10X1]|uniref:glycosyltransferase family 4 protein n=1 Tax=Methanosarcina sp. MSH10X1 TaxID=2507075 RepID=UPI0013E35723|nr:glycosyltransferase family 4 protein [Methanosarcina sp. MSH10X1]
MKIVEVTATFPPYNGGTGNVCYHNSIELVKLGHNVSVYTGQRSNLTEGKPGTLSVKYLKPLFTIGNAPFLPQLLILKDYDVVHLHYPFFFGAEFVYLNSILRNSRYFLTYHNDVISDGLLGLFFKIHKNTLMKLVLNRAEKIIVTSIDYSENSFLLEIWKRNPEKIVEISNGVDIERFNPNNDGSIIRKKLNIENQKIILFVGALDKPHFFKGLEILLESFKEISNPNYRLIIVGDGELKQNYIEKANKMGIISQVIFTGRVSSEDLPLYYAASDVTVLPSTTMGEAFGLVLVEAMATSKPVIASNLPGVRSVVDDGKNGFLVIPGNSEDLTSKIKKILDDEELCCKFGKHGRNKVEERYNWINIAKQLELTLLNNL